MGATSGYQPRHLRQGSGAPAAPKTAERAEASTQEQVGRSAALMSALVVVSRLTGFMRTWGQAYAIGVTVMASCYSIANNLPNQLYELVAAGMLTTAFLPVYMTVKKRAGTEGASAYTSNLVSIVLVAMGAVAVLGFVFAAQMVYTQSFSATDEFDFDLTVYFFRFFVIEVVLYALSSIFSGVLNAERDYFWGQAAPIFNNFVTTASFLIYAALAETSPELALLVLALGNPLGVAVQVVLQIPPMLRHGIRLRFGIDLHDPLLKETLRIGVPSLAVVVASFVTTSVQSSSALSVVPTGASITYYSRLWYTLPYSILTVPITTAMFTELSDSWAKGDRASFTRGIVSGSGQILFFSVPFMLYLIVFSVPLISILAAGSFTPDALAMTASYLCAYAISLPAYAVYMYLQKVASAMRRMVLCAVANAIAAVVQVVALLALTPVFGLDFVAFSSTLFFVTLCVVMLASLRRTLGPIGLGGVLASALRAVALGLAGAVVGAVLLRLLNSALGDCTGTMLRSLGYCVAAGVPALIVTYGAALALKVPEAAMIGRLAGRLLRR
ncbi:murein biosynthesis integral membrane protein MurJ [Thermophilibacter sp. ET337]|uniref:murein biosynthesis integral membrane protein MurJ n=1 Tax=Thermophilibacter sp. ET337 TaxID=2973084 RepID=UPI0021AC4F56|nr:lipid II flippase MurJ [Thermophilibacter sp. ET337]MCR8907254.1 murein biosynthesis integral membrane protein MurJ [Thermophilibacter sp. ET337]